MRIQQGHPATDHSRYGLKPQPTLQPPTMHPGAMQPHPQHSVAAQPSASAVCQGQVPQPPVTEMAQHNPPQSRAESLSVAADRHPTHPATLGAVPPQPALLEGVPAARDGAPAQSTPLQSASAACDSAQAQTGHLEAAPAAAGAAALAPAAWHGAHSCRWHPTDAAQTPPETAHAFRLLAWHHGQSGQQAGHALGKVSPLPQQQVGAQGMIHVRLHGCHERGSCGLWVIPAF